LTLGLITPRIRNFVILSKRIEMPTGVVMVAEQAETSGKEACFDHAVAAGNAHCNAPAADDDFTAAQRASAVPP
jgi:hypothetical protein